MVETDAGQVVFADPPYDPVTPTEGRISHITVRTGDEVRCPLFDTASRVQPDDIADPDAPVATFEPTGTADIRLGDPVADAERAALVVPDQDLPATDHLPDHLARCDAWTTTDGTDSVVLVDSEGAVVAVGSRGAGNGFETTFGVAPAQPADEAADELGTDPPPPPFTAGPGEVVTTFEATLAPGTVVTLVSEPEWLPIETIDATLLGPLRVTGVTVHVEDATC
ncbi:hypothetical protein [Aquipuribacter nitratireducens]|uniref:Uncharacterized protein n=1 Tax=Aquipuribacter nitratireducens TaxID=650104 RepID=A0ABW0GI63_9MICO